MRRQTLYLHFSKFCKSILFANEKCKLERHGFLYQNSVDWGNEHQHLVLGDEKKARFRGNADERSMTHG